METTKQKKTTHSEAYTEAVGRRKTSTARVRLVRATPQSGDGIDQAAKKLITVNDKPLESYFPLQNHQRLIISPFTKADLLTHFKVSVHVQGGGVASQAGAVRHGIARALVSIDETLRKKLKKFGYLTRDPRMVERKKYGLKKARRAPQWSKR